MIKNIKKALLITAMCVATINANAQIKDVKFPYGQFKEIDLENPHLNKIFETFISELQKKDMKYNKQIEIYNDSYLEKITKEKKRGKYRKVDKQNQIIYKINYKEKENVSKIRTLFYIEELKIFNKFVKSVKSTRALTAEEKKIMLEAIKPLHKSYANFTENFKNLVKTQERICFSNPEELGSNKEYEYANKYCGLLYSDFNNEFALNLKSFTVFGMNSLTTKYLGSKNSGNFIKSLQMKIDAMERYEDLNKDLYK